MARHLRPTTGRHSGLARPIASARQSFRCRYPSPSGRRGGFRRSSTLSRSATRTFLRSTAPTARSFWASSPESLERLGRSARASAGVSRADHFRKRRRAEVTVLAIPARMTQSDRRTVFMRHSSQLVAPGFLAAGGVIMASKPSCDRLWILD